MLAANVRAIRRTGTGDTGSGRARLGGLSVLTGAGVGRLTVTDGTAGPVLFDCDFAASDVTEMSLPGDGILFSSTAVVSVATNVTAVTFFFM